MWKRLFGQSSGGSLDDAIAAYKCGSYDKALPAFRAAAGSGSAAGQFYLGLMHQLGRGFPRNETEAVNWYRRAADQGLAEAQFNLGTMYANGWGVSQSDSEALIWLRRAANQSGTPASALLAAISEWPVNKGNDVLNKEMARARWNKYIITQGR
jgi:uncharacterized protein